MSTIKSSHSGFNSTTPSGKSLRVLLVEDHAIVRQGIAQMLNQQPDMTVVGEAEDVADALANIEQLKPDVVLLDMSLKQGDGLELVRLIRERDAKLPILILSMREESVFAHSVIRAGANGYVMKSENIGTVLTAIRQVMAGKIYLSRTMTTKLIHQQVRNKADNTGKSPVDTLSDRERQVFQMIGEWRRPAEIAQALNLSVKTISTYREKIKEKLNLETAAELTQFATQWREHEIAKGSPPVE